MNAAVAYHSKTGHSKKIAQAVSGQAGLPLFDIKEGLPAGDPLDVLFLAGGIYGGKSAPDMLAAIDRLDPAKVRSVVLLTSCMNPEGRQTEVRAALTRKGMTVAAEEFNCRGGFLIFSRKRPNEDDLKQAAAFAKTYLKGKS